MPRLTTLDVEEVLATIEPLVDRRLRRRGLGADDEPGGALEPWADAAPLLAGLAAASVQGLSALGSCQGRRPARLGRVPPWEEPRAAHPCHARANGFSLHAALVVPAGQRDRLQRVCRYVLRPPVAMDRLHLTSDGQVRVSLREPWRDGTTDFVFDPVDFLGRLAVLVPRPRINLLLYYGVLGARADRRTEVVSGQGARAPSAPPEEQSDGWDAEAGTERRDGARGRQWAALMQRTFPPSRG